MNTDNVPSLGRQPGVPAGLLCTKHVDLAIEKGEDPAAAPPGVVMVPFTQVLQTPQGAVVAATNIVVCLECRKADFAPSRNGRLAVA